MLLELRVENYAVIDHVAVEFGPGLNLLTGETGAGKSILIDALALLLGAKASVEDVRHGAEKAVVSATFELDASAAATVRTILAENGLEWEAGDPIILKREVSAGGKGRVFLNNQPATLQVLKRLAPSMAAIHAQLESILSFDDSARLAILDRYCGVQCDGLASAYGQVRALKDRIAALQQADQDRLRLVDLWSFQKNEIESAHLVAGEDQRLETEKRVLANAEKLYAAAMSAYGALYDGEANAAALLKAAERQLEELARIEPRFEASLAAIASARAAVQDASSEALSFAQNLQASPERLAAIEDRLALLDRLKRKYGPTLEEVLAFAEDVARRLHEVEDRDSVLEDLNRSLATSSAEYLAQARAISRRRKEGAKKLERLVEAELNDLAMKASFRIAVESLEKDSQWSATGIDAVNYLIATNPGEPMRPVDQIASGGELSRVMLALKASVEEGAGPEFAGAKGQGRKRQPRLRTLVFDEIDTGIGGRAAEAVGKKLKSLAQTDQVLCITHLPQIASFADRHFVIEKHESSGRTRTSVRLLSPQERPAEIARMLSGSRLTEASLKHAEQLIRANR